MPTFLPLNFTSSLIFTLNNSNAFFEVMAVLIALVMRIIDKRVLQDDGFVHYLNVFNFTAILGRNFRKIGIVCFSKNLCMLTSVAARI